MHILCSSDGWYPLLDRLVLEDQGKVNLIRWRRLLLTWVQTHFSGLTSINFLHPYMSIHILHTFSYTFLFVLVRRICLYTNELLCLVIISFILMTLMLDLAVIMEGEFSF